MELCERGPAVQLQRGNELRVRETVVRARFLLPLGVPASATPQRGLCRTVQCVRDGMSVKSPLWSCCFLPTHGSDEGCSVDNYHSCMCTDCRRPPPAMWCVAGARESASVNTWAGLQSLGGQKQGEPCPQARSNHVELECPRLGLVEQAGTLHLRLPTLLQWGSALR